MQADNGLQIQIIVDQNIVVFGPMGHFTFGVAQPVLDRRGGIRCPALHPAAQFLQRWRQNENAHHLRAHHVIDLQRPLPVNVKRLRNG